jgi:hypothetical protein
MSRTVNGIEPTPAAMLGDHVDPTPTVRIPAAGLPRFAPAPPEVSRVPWLTVSTAGMVLGLVLLIGSRPATSPPLALASPTPASAVAVAEQVRQLADRVAQLESEVAELRSPRVARRASLED